MAIVFVLFLEQFMKALLVDQSHIMFCSKPVQGKTNTEILIESFQRKILNIKVSKPMLLNLYSL